MPDIRPFATLRKSRRVWAVAAIHGESDRLARLHVELGRRFRPGNRLVYLGNYLGYGSQIRTTLDHLLKFRAELLSRPRMMACDIVFLRGAQEEMWSKLLKIHLAFNPAEVIEWMMERGVGATLEAYGGNGESGLARARAGATGLARWTAELRAAMQARPGHDQLMNVLRRAAFTDDGNLLFVHAGIDTNRPLAAQGDALWWGGTGFETLTEPYGGFRMVVRGFDRANKGLRVTRMTASLDGGCGFGGKLRAGCFDRAGRLVDTIEI
jgi:serine/threonine protein phosphatase 1